MSNKKGIKKSNKNEKQNDLISDYRKTIGLFATGVTVLIIEHEGQVRCMTANAVSSLSLEPIQLLVCPSKKAVFSEFVKLGARFSVNILAIHQENVSNYFAGAEVDIDKSQVHYDHLFQASGAPPRLKECLATFSCTVSKQYDGGDHWIVVGEVNELYQSPVDNKKPLLFFGGNYHYPAKKEEDHISPSGDPYN